jgi:hypothetical protein
MSSGGIMPEHIPLFVFLLKAMGPEPLTPLGVSALLHDAAALSDSNDSGSSSESLF